MPEQTDHRKLEVEPRELPCICPECGEILDWSQTETQSETQSRFGPYGECIMTWTWTWVWDWVSCPNCGFHDCMCTGSR